MAKVLLLFEYCDRHTPQIQKHGNHDTKPVLGAVSWVQVALETMNTAGGAWEVVAEQLCCSGCVLRTSAEGQKDLYTI